MAIGTSHAMSTNRRAAQKRDYDACRRAHTRWRAWYKTPEWQATRKAQLQAEALCRRCLQRGRRVMATVADHVSPHRGDRKLFLDRNNLQSLCATCHNSSKQAEERRGYAIGNGPDGRPLDPSHPWRQTAHGENK